MKGLLVVVIEQPRMEAKAIITIMFRLALGPITVSQIVLPADSVGGPLLAHPLG